MTEKETQQTAEQTNEASELDDLLPCTCPGVQEAMKAGVASMKKTEPPAPSFVIADYVNEMTYGQWVHCECAASAVVE